MRELLDISLLTNLRPVNSLSFLFYNITHQGISLWKMLNENQDLIHFFSCYKRSKTMSVGLQKVQGSEI